MGSWDYYCALCGSTFQGMHYISQKPRTADREIPEHDQNQDDNGHISDGQESADGNESLESWDEERCYDPDIVSCAEAAWSLNLRCIGLNPESPTLSKAFVSAVGRDNDYGGFEAEPGDDPSAPDDLDTSYAAYGNPDGKIVYPFHSKCFDLLQQVISFKQGSKVKVELGFDDDWERKIPSLDLDKDLLYELFAERAGRNFDHRLEIPYAYGEPEPPNEQFWEATPGEEIFIADPAKQNDLAVKTIRDVWLSVSSRSTTSIPPAQNDPFVRLPVELLLIITSALDPSSFLNLLHASPHVHLSLDKVTSLWMQRLREDMPWFHELHHFLDDLTSPANAQGIDPSADTKELPHNSLRHLFIWAHHTTTPRRGMKGPLIGIANRRRIWGLCTQLADPYLAQLPPRDIDVENEEEAQFLNESVCLEMPVVTTPPPERFHTARAFWVHTWSEIDQRERDFTLKLYWERDNLIGLGTTMDDGKAPRLSLFGVEQQDTGPESLLSVTEMRVDRGDWITGFILYWPDTSEGYRKAGNKNWVSATTVLCASGRKETFGEVYWRDIKRPVLPSKGMSIVGLTGHVGKTGKHYRYYRQFTRFGLLQVPSSNIKDHGRIDKAYPPNVVMPTWAERLAWTNDCTEIFTTGPSGRISLDALPLPFTRARSSSGIPIWDVPNLRIQQPITTISNHYHDDLIAYHPLIWAQDAEEARSLRRLTGWVVDGNIACGFTEDGERWERFVPDICGIKANYAPGSTLEPRSIGMEEFVDEYQDFKWHENQCTHLDIDGAGGEMITAVAVAQELCSPKAVKLITNRGREVYWGEPNQPEENWQTYTAPDGEMLIGIVSSFSKASGWDPEAKEPLRSAMSSVAVLSLPTK